MNLLPVDFISSETPIDLPLGLGEEGVVNPTRGANQTTDVAITTGQPETQVAEELKKGVQTSVASAKDIASKAYSVDMVDVLINQDTPVQAAELLGNQSSKNVNPPSDFMIEDSATKANPYVGGRAAAVLRRQQKAYEIAEEYFRKANGGTTDVVLDFFDRFFVRHLGAGVYEDITNRSERKGFELAASFTDFTITDEEWEEVFRAYADEVNEEGAFRSENLFAIQQLMNEVMNAGYDPSAAFDQVLGAGEIASLGFGAALRAGKTISRLSAVRGVDEATEAASTATHVTKTLDPELEVEKLPTALSNTAPGDTQIQISRSQQIENDNALVQEIGRMIARGSLGVDATPDQIQAAQLEIQGDIADLTSRAIADVDVEAIDFSGAGLRDLGVTVKLGRKTDGAPFSPRAKGAAEKLAKVYRDNGFAADVVPAKLGDETSGWNVRIQQRLNLDPYRGTLSDPFEPKKRLFNGIRQAVLNIFGSQRSIISEFDQQLSILGEGFQSAVRNAAEPYLKSIRSLPVQNQKIVSGVLKQLRDGPEASIRNYYNRSEFATKYRALHPDGKDATDADYDAFMAAVTLSDTAYYLKANKIMRWYTRNGYKALDLDDGKGVAKGTLVKDVSSLDEDTFIWSPSRQETIRLSDLPAEERLGIWKLEKPLQNGAEYTHNPKKVRSLAYDDVLGYNAGGSRLNPDFNYFIVTGSGRGRALLGTFSIKQANRAVADLEVLQSAYNSGSLTDDIVLANNSWNPNVTSVKDFDDLVKKKGWDLSQKVDFKPRDGIVEEDVPLKGETEGTYQMAQFNRNNDVLMEYGGTDAWNQDPMRSITQQLSNGVSELSLRNYNQSAKASWLRKAGYTKQVEEGSMSLDFLFDNADLSNIKDPTTKRQLEAIRTNIKARNGAQGEIADRFEQYGRELSEFVFDRTGRKIKIGDPTNVLMNLGFQSAFGFLNLSQFVLQASHMAAIGAISGLTGVKGAALVPAMRLAIHADRTHGVVDGYARIAKFAGLSTDQVKEIAEYIKISGRDIIENDEVTKGTGPSWDIVSFKEHDMRATTLNKTVAAASNAARVAGKISILPFSEGEKLTRYTGMLTASMEYMAKNPGKSILTPDARAWIAGRQDDLTFNMTNASRSAWQSGAMRLPMQWMSYSFRSMEALLVGSQFTAWERIRLGTMLTIQAGLFGLTASKAADYLADQFGLEPSGTTYVALKYGAIDGIMSWALSEATGEQVRTAFGTRLSPLDGLLNMLENVQEDPFLTLLMGPSGQIVGGGGMALASAIGNLYNGRTEMAKDDLHTLLRTPSGLNNYLTAASIINTGTYRTKSGKSMHGEWNDTDAILAAVGITNFKTADYYERSEVFWKEGQEVRAWQKDVRNLAGKAFDLAEAGEVERASQMMDEITNMIEASGLAPIEKTRLLGRIKNDTNYQAANAIMREIQRENPFGAQVVDTYK